MCDRLQGRYPKTFKFKGWHPQCMCYAVPILMDEETFDENELGDLKAALRGTEYKQKQAKNVVLDVPDGFKAWVAENMEASAGWSSTPYFIKDNFIDGDLSKGLSIVLPEKQIDPVQAQFDALMPAIEAARKIAEEWGLDFRVKGLDEAVAARDVKGASKFISLITTEGTKFTNELSAFFKDAADLLKQLQSTGGGVFNQEIAELTQYMTNLSKNKADWSSGASFYQSELKRIKEKLRNYNTSPEASMTASQKSLLADARQTIKNADEWGINTSKAKELLQKFIDNPHFDWRNQPDSENYEGLLEIEYFALEDKIDKAERKVDTLISDARALIKEASSLDGLEAERTELDKWVFALSGSDKAYTWATFKRDINKSFKTLQDKVVEAKKKKEAEEAAKPKLETVIENVKKAGVDYLEVKKHEKQPTMDEIIARVGGGDNTDGSCASLAYAYAANRGGLDVLDFRDGQSRYFFALRSNGNNITDKVGGYRSYDASGMDLMKTTEVGKEYVIRIGRHAAVVRQVSKGKYEYLELQSAYSNGWKPLNAKQFSWRFSAKGRCGGSIVEISKLYSDPSFKTLMGYINTASDKQKKSATGTIK